MTDFNSLYATLKQTADPKVADAIQTLVETGADHELNRINLIEFAARTGLAEEKVISGFLHASQIGIFDLTWNVLCPGCSGVLGAHDTLKQLQPEDYHCGLCAAGYQASIDDQVEVAFTVSPRVRRIAAHDPHTLPSWDYWRQIFWSSGIDINEDSFGRLVNEATLEAVELAPGEKAVLSLQLPAEFVIVFEPVTHSALFLDVKGEPTKDKQNASLTFDGVHAPTGTVEMRPGPLRLTLENQSRNRVLPSVWIAGEALHDLLGKRKPIVTAKRILANQTFRDLYKADNLSIDQRLKITSLTFLFTDLKGSTALYERVGDLAAFDLVRAHFRALLEIIASEGGAVVKTIGDAVMAQAVAAGIQMRKAMDELNEQRGTKDLLVKIGIHEGACLAVMLNDRQDYFGQTVNIAARVQGQATERAINATGPVVRSAAVMELLDKAGLTPAEKSVELRGIADKVVIYEIP